MPKLASAQSEVLRRRNEALSHREEELEQLRRQIAWLRQKLFGSGQSERLDRAQLQLMLEGLEAQAATLQGEAPEPAPKAPKARRVPRTSREDQYGHLPIEEEMIIDPEEVQADPEAFEQIGEERTFEVVRVPGRFYRRAIVRRKFRRVDQREAPPLLAPAPTRVVEGIASIELLVELILSKYLDHLPLYRQSRIYQRDGVQLARPSMARWDEVVTDWLKPLYHYMGHRLKEGGYIQADETPIRYLDPDVKKGKAQKGYLVPFSRPGGDVVFTWSLSRSEKAITAFLDGYTGLLQTDAYIGWLNYAAAHPQITLLGCMAHARRRFHQALGAQDSASAHILRSIGELYQLEAQWREAALTPSERREERQSQALPRLQELKKRILSARADTLPKSALGEACQYALNHWPLLTAYCEHGEAEIDNNLVENAIRPSAIGRKNWLFIGHPAAGERPAILYSLLISCQRHGHDPRTYLRDVLRQLCLEPDRHDPRNLDVLTPEGWQPPEAAMASADQ
jgi:transposase